MDMATRSRDQEAEELDVPVGDASAIPLLPGLEPLRREKPKASPIAGASDPLDEDLPLEPSRALVPSDLAPPRAHIGDRLTRIAYRMGVPAALLDSPFKRPGPARIKATVASPLTGDRAAGMALRAGHFLVHGLKLQTGQIEMSGTARSTPPVERVVHGFTWLRDLASAGPREECARLAEGLLARWLDANPGTPKGPAAEVEHTALRVIAWLVHAPLLFSSGDGVLRGKALKHLVESANWLDRKANKTPDGFARVAAWCALTAAGLLLPDGKPRRLHGEAGLVRALGDFVFDDGGACSRSPIAQMDAIALLIDLEACYEAVGREPPAMLATMKELLVPPLLALRHSDGGLGSWQGAGAIAPERVASLIDASRVRARGLKDVGQWGYHRIKAGRTILQFDAAPPPRGPHSRSGCASTLAFELSCGDQRIIVNCGGGAWAGGAVPVRIEQGLRATAAHSTLTLDNANSTAVLINGALGKGVEEVEADRRDLAQGEHGATRLEASHNGYAARYGLAHQRILMLREDGSELRGEDVLLPVKRKGQRGKIGFAIRFHLAPGIEVRLSEDARGAGLALPDGSYWQFRLAGETAQQGGELQLEDSMWVDGHGRARATKQLVIQGMTSRGGGNFPWLLKKMG
ncbi:heparinase II/III family protein [Altererythrobacter sp. MF3-039]|uniref:heparinase II/III family protein n=1 Tax=Altererythrobacter sp. MF3-039 TaxID=3252901 RepID=UPI00390CD336